MTAAREQAGTYFDALTERERPRFQLLCDFQTFELLDRDEREETRFALADLPQHAELVTKLPQRGHAVAVPAAPKLLDSCTPFGGQLHPLPSNSRAAGSRILTLSAYAAQNRAVARIQRPAVALLPAPEATRTISTVSPAGATPPRAGTR